MRKLTHLTLIAAMLILALPLSPVSASSPPLDVQFVFDEAWYDPPEGPIQGTFTASGPAVEAGLMCPEGITFNIWGHATPKNEHGSYTFHILKALTCTGTDPEVDWFIMRLEGQSTDETGTFNWMVWKASGIFAKLHGTGNATVDYDGPYEFVGTLLGKLHID
jgi:hypothetical protein